MCPPELVAVAGAINTAGQVAGIGADLMKGRAESRAAASASVFQIKRGAALRVQAQQTQQIADTNAVEFERQADLRVQKAKFDGAQAINRYNRVYGDQMAAIGKSGLDVGTFSDVIADSALESNLEVQQLKWTGDQEARNLKVQAYNQRANADLQAKGLLLEAEAADVNAKTLRTTGQAAAVSGLASAATKAGNLAGDWAASSKSVSVTSPWQTTVIKT